MLQPYNQSDEVGNLTHVLLRTNVEEYQKNHNYIATVLFVTFATIGINLFWRKSFVLSRDLPFILLSEIIAIVVFISTSSQTWTVIFASTIAFCLLHWTLNSKVVHSYRRPRNALDIQDLINFIFTAATIYILVLHNRQMFAKETNGNACLGLMQLWTSIPILSIFQIIR